MSDATPAVPIRTSPWGPLASWGDRVVATLLDAAFVLVAAIAVAIVVAILGALSDVLASIVAFIGYLALVAYGFYIAYMTGARGGTPAKRVMGLKVVKLADGEVLGGGMGIVRQLAHIIDSIICYIGYLFPLWDPQRQTIADKIMGTVVLREQAKEAFGAQIFRL